MLVNPITLILQIIVFQLRKVAEAQALFFFLNVFY